MNEYGRVGRRGTRRRLAYGADARIVNPRGCWDFWGYTGADFEAVIALMAQGAYDTSGWVAQIPIGDVVAEGFEALHAGNKMKVLVDPTR